MSTLHNPHSIAGDFNAAVFSFLKRSGWIRAAGLFRWERYSDG